ncbi:hypothetical protein KIN20_008730 [Parelaphostrongylus tenuis]|uniref:Uncharacterized protein n=1 Tax=Parelaphostrongylus tenuis TaxID=148309 RepID=A0AAD5M8D3_PARTN|nr:hypothetical protein KIN20_008730 [Parelaphostrongylus tenuis]
MAVGEEYLLAEINNEDFTGALEGELSSGACELATELDASHTFFLTHLHQLNFVYKRSRQVSHDFTETQPSKESVLSPTVQQSTE